MHLRGHSVSMVEFLSDCITALSDGKDTTGLAEAHRTFLTAGAAALAAASGEAWVQLGLAPGAGQARLLYPEVASLAREWLAHGEISDFFFMHKPPGLRLRFAPAVGHTDALKTALHQRVREWREAGLVTEIRPAVYEPEMHLFGGPASMSWAHRLFTVDSLTWLDQHTRPDGCPSWALSLLMLRTVFEELRGDAGEDRDVWARVREAGRRWPSGAADGTADVAAEFLRCWSRPGELARAVPEHARHLAERHAEQARPLLRQWWTEYFSGDQASIGPRQAAAHYVVFHWNRAALSFGRQVLITESLARVADHVR
ncbi:thiopeptide-type bacteriocin biosynthesis protein [Amycolatopsis nigrescens]|uniref:thiopeptide-type bacteriocin biosynthesis protein n=1 Tax=Amycolatopsis nigrescens TaxID=381445 RepID=UPI001FE036E9|nr:thiopeptide-type bacteriocin biosynthesis protein [Amycolatopsis nigrescens]